MMTMVMAYQPVVEKKRKKKVGNNVSEITN